MSIDRLHSNDLVVTHELLASLLGTRRESITSTALNLKKDGIIEYARGHVTVLNRKKLEARACECYETVRLEYDRLLPKQAACQVSSEGAIGKTGLFTAG